MRMVLVSGIGRLPLSRENSSKKAIRAQGAIRLLAPLAFDCAAFYMRHDPRSTLAATKKPGL
jgi:hypothetical protein